VAVVLDPQRWLELRRFRGLVESGAMSLTEVAKETGLNWRAVSKYLAADGPAAPPRRSPNGRSRVRVIDEFAPLVDSMLRVEILMEAAVIHERLVAEYGFTGNYQRTKLYVQEVRPRIAEELGITPNELGACTAVSR
jgi:transposase